MSSRMAQALNFHFGSYSDVNLVSLSTMFDRDHTVMTYFILFLLGFRTMNAIEDPNQVRTLTNLFPQNEVV